MSPTTRTSRALLVPLTAGALSLGLGIPLASPSAAVSPPARSTVQRVISDQRVTESSGLARSTYQRGTLITHNDSGDSARVFAIDRRGRTLAELRLSGAYAADWEDITTGLKHSIWVGDIGDNGRSRDTISIYRFREPKALVNRTVASTRFQFRYSDGRHDAEALMISPRTGRLFVISKQSGAGKIYRAPRVLSTTRVNVLRPVGSAPATVTAASFAPGGRRFALGTYTSAYIYRGFSDTPRKISLPKTKQGESLEFNRRGDSLFRGSEGNPSPVYRVLVG